ncbi:hypothetical protein FYJ77_00770 [Schaalia hyovaginalis]|nr:hypothetical protein [Schaalia hyovaginalis]
MNPTMSSPTEAHRTVRLAALVLIAFCLLLAAPLGAKASTRHVVDEVDFISDATEAELEAEIARISKTYGQDVVILYRNLNEGESPMAVADDYFDYEGYGLGAERSGVLLLVSPSTRDWWISTRGESIPTFTDKGIKALGEILTEPLGDDEWEQAARTYVAQTERYMEAARKGAPITSAPKTWKDRLTQWGGALAVGVLGGFGAGRGLVRSLFVSKMKNEGLEPAASSYVRSDALQIIGGSDVFITTNTTRTARPESSSESSSGSSTHTSSSGATHGGGGGKF